MSSMLLRGDPGIGHPGSDLTDMGGGARARGLVTVSDQESLQPEDSRLDRVIETELIPRLMVAHSVVTGAELPIDPPKDMPADMTLVERFADIVLYESLDASREFISNWRDDGAGLDEVFLHLLTPAARLLGKYWDEDEADFSQVTVGLSQLQNLLRELSPASDLSEDLAPKNRRALLAAVPGDQHTFGVFMVEEFFRRDGWDVVTSVLETSDDLQDLVASEHFDVIGFSMSRDELVDQLEMDIHKIYKGSRNQAVRILVGGRCFLEDPDLVDRIGADATACDARDAVRLANELVALHKSP
jgi:methanogenic corrinoid protein MtbC1